MNVIIQNDFFLLCHFFLKNFFTCRRCNVSRTIRWVRLYQTLAYQVITIFGKILCFEASSQYIKKISKLYKGLQNPSHYSMLRSDKQDKIKHI
jgi:hypothetical protein